MEPARKSIRDFMAFRQSIDRSVSEGINMMNSSIELLQAFKPRNEGEKKEKLDLIRDLRFTCINIGSSGNIKFYSQAIVAKEEQGIRLSSLQRQLAEMTKETETANFPRAPSTSLPDVLTASPREETPRKWKTEKDFESPHGYGRYDRNDDRDNYKGASNYRYHYRAPDRRGHGDYKRNYDDYYQQRRFD